MAISHDGFFCSKYFQASPVKTFALKEADCKVLLLRSSVHQQISVHEKCCGISDEGNKLPDNKRLQPSSSTVVFMGKQSEIQALHLLLGVIYPNMKNVKRHKATRLPFHLPFLQKMNGRQMSV